MSQIGVALGALLVNIFSARALGPSGRGVLGLHLQITYIVGAAALLGRDRSFLATAAQGVSLSSGMRQMVRLLAMPLMLGAVASLAAGLAFTNFPTLAAGALIVGYALVLAGIMLSRFSRRSVRPSPRNARGSSPGLFWPPKFLLLPTSIAL